MRSEFASTNNRMRSRGALTASTPSVRVPRTGEPNPVRKRPELPSCDSVTLGSRRMRTTVTVRRVLWLTNRDHQIVELVLRAQALRDDQIQLALFSLRTRLGDDSRCQRRLTLLVRHRYLDRLPRRSASEPAVYVLSQRSVEGNRMLRERLGEEEFRRYRDRIGALQHLLAVNDVRVRVYRACRDLQWSLPLWHQPRELAPLLTSAHLIPDAYFKVQREVNGQKVTAAFFLEVERVGKSSQVLREKLTRYADLYYSGRYQEIFGTKALRVLFVFANPSAGETVERVNMAVKDARRLGVTVARFAGLDQLKKLTPADCLTEAVWHDPGSSGPVALFEHSLSDQFAGGPR